jgi:N-acetylmuramic acid 6-phosphate etherase
MDRDDDSADACVPEAGLPPTERINPLSRGIDAREAAEIVQLIHEEDLRAWQAVGAALRSIASVVDAVAAAFRAGGRLIYLGAGNSGRLGVLDAAGCPPTFGVEPGLVHGIMAGGDMALRLPVEDAEDAAGEGALAVAEAGVRAQDVVCGIAASGTTPFVWGGLNQAFERDATTVLVTCNPGVRGTPGAKQIDFLVLLDVGPEVIAGSTRMKSGTATKMVLSMISTAAMVRWGKVCDNLMVDVVPRSKKQERRALSMVAKLGGVEEGRALELLEQAAGRVKAAVVMARGGMSAAEAADLLERHGGLLRNTLEAAGAQLPAQLEP